MISDGRKNQEKAKSPETLPVVSELPNSAHCGMPRSSSLHCNLLVRDNLLLEALHPAEVLVHVPWRRGRSLPAGTEAEPRKRGDRGPRRPAYWRWLGQDV